MLHGETGWDRAGWTTDATSTLIGDTQVGVGWRKGAVVRLTQPLQRQGMPEDVAQAAVYLASDRSAQVTGLVIPVDGGTTLGPPPNQMQQILARGRERNTK